MGSKRGAVGPPGSCAHMEHFLATCLLVLVEEAPGHGYSLMDRLADFGFPPDSFNIGTLYRTLRRLEKAGLVTSDWEEGGQGPRRRVYTITDQGRESLSLWIEVIKGNRRRIDRLLARYSALHGKEGLEG